MADQKYNPIVLNMHTAYVVVCKLPSDEDLQPLYNAVVASAPDKKPKGEYSYRQDIYTAPAQATQEYYISRFVLATVVFHLSEVQFVQRDKSPKGSDYVQFVVPYFEADIRKTEEVFNNANRKIMGDLDILAYISRLELFDEDFPEPIGDSTRVLTDYHWVKRVATYPNMLEISGAPVYDSSLSEIGYVCYRPDLKKYEYEDGESGVEEDFEDFEDLVDYIKELYPFGLDSVKQVNGRREGYQCKLKSLQDEANLDRAYMQGVLAGLNSYKYPALCEMFKLCQNCQTYYPSEDKESHQH